MIVDSGFSTKNTRGRTPRDCRVGYSCQNYDHTHTLLHTHTFLTFLESILDNAEAISLDKISDVQFDRCREKGKYLPFLFFAFAYSLLFSTLRCM